MKKSLLFVSLVAVALIGFGLYKTVVQPKQPGVGYFSDDSLGLSFRYPKSWGKAELLHWDNRTPHPDVEANGQRFSIQFHSYPEIMFGGVTTDYSAPMDASPDQLKTLKYQDGTCTLDASDNPNTPIACATLPTKTKNLSGYAFHDSFFNSPMYVVAIPLQRSAEDYQYFVLYSSDTPQNQQNFQDIARSIVVKGK